MEPATKARNYMYKALVRGHLGIANTHPAPSPPATWAPSSHHPLGYVENPGCLLSSVAEKEVGPVVIDLYTNDVIHVSMTMKVVIILGKMAFLYDRDIGNNI